MTGRRALLSNFVEHRKGSVKFGGSQKAKIMGYGDLELEKITISEVWHVEGLHHNLFSIGKFCDKGLHVSFKSKSCILTNSDEEVVLTGNRDGNLYTLDAKKIKSSKAICLVTKSVSQDTWLWHRRMSHLNFRSLTELSKKNLVKGMPKLKNSKDCFCSACLQGKMQHSSHKAVMSDISKRPLDLLHIDLCGPMRVQSINGKKYILVIVDDYSRYTWVKFLRSKAETQAILINFIKETQLNLELKVKTIRSDNGTEFKNFVVESFLESMGIRHQFSAVRTPQQNGVVERRNRTLIEAARTMLAYSKLPMFLWAEAVSTACYTQNRSIVNKRFNKTPYELINNRIPNVKFFHVFGCRCYVLRDREDIGKLESKADEGIFIGYSKNSKAFRIYNKKTKVKKPRCRIDKHSVNQEHDQKQPVSMISINTKHNR